MLLYNSDVCCIEYLVCGFIYVVCILCTIRALLLCNVAVGNRGPLLNTQYTIFCTCCFIRYLRFNLKKVHGKRINL